VAAAGERQSEPWRPPRLWAARRTGGDHR